MSEKKLSAKLRTSDFGSAGSRRLLRNGEIPAVVYGKGEPLHVIVNAREFNAKRSGFSESTLITLSVEGDKDHQVFVKTFQEDLLRNCIHHIDFYEITAGHSVRTHVRIELQGTPIGCKAGGVLDQVIHEVEIECLPKDLPEMFVADVSGLDMNEAFRMMRTNLDFMAGKDSGTKVILVSSFNPGSGKTFITMNLAASLAIKGTKAVLLDLDLRKGTMSKTLNLKREGISMYLSGNEDSLDRITVNLAENMDVIPAGTLPPNPSELLVSDRFKKLIDELRKKYDYVFLDCPPIDIVADTSIIAREADLTIFVMRAGLMDKRALPMVEEIAKGGLYPRMTVVLNGVEQNRKYGYGRYGYGYGYGYSSEAKRRS